MSTNPFEISAPSFLDGYVDETRNRKATELAPPSQNVRITTSGTAYTRPGYEDTGWDLSQANKSATSHHMERYNVTFFALGTKVYYVEHDRANAVVDTGITLTDGTKTRFGEYAGDLYLTNTTDGVFQIHVMRLNDSAPDSGDSSVTVDQDGAGRLIAFSDTSGNLRIRGTDEAYSSVAATGVVTLSGTLSASYADDDIAITVEDLSSSLVKAGGITFWKERMVLYGVIHDETSSDTANNSVYMSKFATVSTIEDVIDFTTAGTATIEMIGKGGEVTNVVSTRDYIYHFKEDEVYFSSVADVNTSTGATLPQLLSSQYGCVNGACAEDMGGVIPFLTKNHRIIAIKIATDSGAPVVFPDEEFDRPIRNLLSNLDEDQSSAHMFYWKGGKLLFVQCSIDSEALTLVYDNNIGRWLPPDTNKSFSQYFEKDGQPYATASGDDTIYSVEIGLSDDGTEIDCQMATGQFEFQDGRITTEWKEILLSGSLTQPTEITFEGIVDGGTPNQKAIDATNVSFNSGEGIGAVVLGDEVIGGSVAAEDFGNFDKRLAIYPSYGGDFQAVLSSFGDGQAFKWKSYTIKARALSSPTLTLS